MARFVIGYIATGVVCECAPAFAGAEGQQCVERRPGAALNTLSGLFRALLQLEGTP